MKKDILRLETAEDGESQFRTSFKNRHGREIFLSVEISGPDCTITDCFYIDRNQGRTGAARYSARPKKLLTRQFPAGDLLSVIETDLDKKFYGVELVQTCQAGLPLDDYLKFKAESGQRKYHFLILVGEGELVNGLPVLLRTRLKTKLHRAVYVELAYYKDGMGVVRQCCYYDRRYQQEDRKVTPPQLISCFFPYTQEGILNLLNYEICCDFTHIIVTSGIDLDSNKTPLCGAV